MFKCLGRSNVNCSLIVSTCQQRKPTSNLTECHQQFYLMNICVDFSRCWNLNIVHAENIHVWPEITIPPAAEHTPDRANAWRKGEQTWRNWVEWMQPLQICRRFKYYNHINETKIIEFYSAWAKQCTMMQHITRNATNNFRVIKK